VSALVPFRTQLVLKSSNTAGTDQSNASGICGGYPGAGSQVSIVSQSGIWDLLADRKMPLDYSEFAGAPRHLPSKADAILGPDDVLVFYPPGGGGYGDPLARDPARVAFDVEQGRVSSEAALEHYGVVIAGDGKPDQAATAAVRARRKAIRLEATASEASSPSVSATLIHPVGAHLDLVALDGQRLLRCRGCGSLLGPSLRDPSARVTRHLTDLRAAGPWLAVRWMGQSPNFELEETLCPSCGTLLDVRERLKEAAAVTAS
jgi:N-methylhydantoinase B